MQVAFLTDLGIDFLPSYLHWMSVSAVALHCEGIYI